MMARKHTRAEWLMLALMAAVCAGTLLVPFIVR